MLIFFLDCSIFVFSLIFERGKKCYCVNLMKFIVAMQHYCMIKMIKTTNNEMFKEFVRLEFNK